MNLRARLVLALLAAALPAATLASWTWSSSRAVTLEQKLSVPLQAGPWQLDKESQLEADVLEMIQPLAYVMRRYQAPGRTPIWLYVGIYAGRAGQVGAHNPNVCYPAQGWEVLETESARIPVTDADEIAAQLLYAHKGRRTESVYYWFQPAGRWPAHGASEQILRMFDAVAGRPQYAFVRVSGAGLNTEAAVADRTEFSGEIGPAIRSEIERLF